MKKCISLLGVLLLVTSCGLYGPELSPQVAIQQQSYAGYSCQQLAAETQRLANLLSVPVPTAPANTTVNNTAVAVVVTAPVVVTQPRSVNPNDVFNQPSTANSFLSGYQQGMNMRSQREAAERLRSHDRLMADYDRVQRESISRSCGMEPAPKTK